MEIPYELLLKIAKSKCRFLKRINSEELLADAWILMIEEFGEYTIANFNKSIRKAVNQHCLFDVKRSPEAYERRMEYVRQWIADNYDKWKKGWDKWVANNPEKVREWKRNWAKKNAKNNNEKAKKWQAENPEKYKAYQKAYREGKDNPSNFDRIRELQIQIENSRKK